MLRPEGGNRHAALRGSRSRPEALPRRSPESSRAVFVTSFLRGFGSLTSGYRMSRSALMLLEASSESSRLGVRIVSPILRAHDAGIVRIAFHRESRDVPVYVATDLLLEHNHRKDDAHLLR